MFLTSTVSSNDIVFASDYELNSYFLMLDFWDLTFSFISVQGNSVQFSEQLWFSWNKGNCCFSRTFDEFERQVKSAET